ncbi:hypothetical protein HDU81_007217 [Chytriomyces hyalinus]|nr:hypothetical protein HDU81_007217 [Chytriomyces hyalinus]
MDLLRIGGFRMSGFNVTAPILIHAGGGFYWENGAVAREVKQAIIETTVSYYDRVREVLAEEKSLWQDSIGALQTKVWKEPSPVQSRQIGKAGKQEEENAKIDS